MSNKKALFVGINYPGTSHALRGCVNDVVNMEKIITSKYNFTNIKMLKDNEATTKGILDGLNWLIEGATSGDILFFHYSGHGSQIPERIHTSEPDGVDEILCPIDLNWRDKTIRDDDLKNIFDKIPTGVHLTVLLDCCHSGSGLDHCQTLTFQPLGIGETRDHPEIMEQYDIRVVGNRYLPPPPDIQQIINENHLDFYTQRGAQHRNVNQTSLLISGCQSHQTSADAYIEGSYVGACTFMLLKTLEENNWDIDYKTLIISMNNKLASKGFSQRPELNGAGHLFTKKFIREPETTEDDRPESTTPPKPVKLCRRCHKPREQCKCTGWWRPWRWYWGRK